MTRTLLKFNSGEDIYDVTDDSGRAVDPLDLSEALEELNDLVGFDLYKPDVVDKTVEGEDVALVVVDETEDGLDETIIESNQNNLSIMLSEKGWVMEDAEVELPDDDSDDEDEDDDSIDEDDDDYASDDDVDDDFE